MSLKGRVWVPHQFSFWPLRHEKKGKKNNFKLNLFCSIDAQCVVLCPFCNLVSNFLLTFVFLF